MDTKNRQTVRFADFLVEMMGIEPMSENPLIGLSSQAVCYLAFPLGSESRHPHPQSSPFLPDRFKGERPVQVHHCDDAQSGVVVLSGGTGGPQATALLSQALTGVTQAAIATVLLSFNLKFGQLSRLPGSLRLSYLRIPVETIAPPYLICLRVYFTAILQDCQEKSIVKFCNRLTFSLKCVKIET